MNDDLLELVRADGLIEPSRPLVVLLSGGRDSVCLLDIAVRVAGPQSVRALHVEYGLRDSAVADAHHCQTLCAELDVPLRTLHPRHRAQDGNLQAWARRERYAAAAALAAELDRARPPARGGPCQIATGHTASDQAETILYRLASSLSRRALLGMRRRTPGAPAGPAGPGTPAARDGRSAATIVRPLLGVTREQTTAHCRARGLPYRDDESNDSDAYARVRIRHQLLAALERVHPAAVANVAAVAEILAAEAAVLDELVDGVLAREPPGTVRLELLRAQAPALRRLIVQRLADRAAGRPAAGVGRRAEDVVALPARGRASVHLPCGVRASVSAGVVRFDRTPPVHLRTACRRPVDIDSAQHE
ncbi:MAG TPA: tRNA lysidine(34) synthetase TilS [Solirubrobacteraceae bacterium]|nr:tRNA lysidine(34) synthetase TilS [Solirubrobacteraceae bacterium]